MSHIIIWKSLIDSIKSITQPTKLAPYCIIIEDKKGGQGEVYPNLDQTFQAEFNELLFISSALKLNWNFIDSPVTRLELECN